MPIVPVTFASLRTPQTVAENKLSLLNALATLGFPALSWESSLAIYAYHLTLTPICCAVAAT